jgi:hypothetical protein
MNMTELHQDIALSMKHSGCESCELSDPVFPNGRDDVCAVVVWVSAESFNIPNFFGATLRNTERGDTASTGSRIFVFYQDNDGVLQHTVKSWPSHVVVTQVCLQGDGESALVFCVAAKEKFYFREELVRSHEEEDFSFLPTEEELRDAMFASDSFNALARTWVAMKRRS